MDAPNEGIENVAAIAELLDAGTTADVWYDARKHGDEAGEKRIDEIQLAMSDAARLLPRLTDVVEKLYAFASDLAEKHGMNGTDTLTDKEHALLQDVFPEAANLVAELREKIVVSEEASPTPTI